MDEKPWSRLPNESAQAYAAFCVYRNMGPERSTVKVGQELGKSTALIQRWSANWQWVERVKAFDENLDGQELRAQEKARKEMAERHARQAMIFQQKVVERLRELNPAELSPADLARWFDIAVKIERLSRGESTEKAEVEHGGTVTQRHESDLEERLNRYEQVYLNLARGRKTSGTPAGDGAGESVHPARPDTEASRIPSAT